MDKPALKPKTYEESIRENKEANERAKFLYEYFKDKNPEFAERVKNNISLMPPDDIVDSEVQKQKDDLLKIEIEDKKYKEIKL